MRVKIIYSGGETALDDKVNEFLKTPNITIGEFSIAAGYGFTVVMITYREHSNLPPPPLPDVDHLKLRK